MKILKDVLKYYMLIIGLFIVLIAFDCFSTEDTFWYELACFSISMIPGVVIVSMMLIFWKKEFILKFIVLALAIVAFILFKMYDVRENFGIILAIFLPMILYALSVFILEIKENEK